MFRPDRAETNVDGEICDDKCNTNLEVTSHSTSLFFGSAPVHIEMYEENGQSVLRCGQCDKPFDKRELFSLQASPIDANHILTLYVPESSLKRHGYYCRSQKATHSPRVRSCLSCAKRKARCDMRRPVCTRCTTKTLHCHYPADSTKAKTPSVQCSDVALADERRKTNFPLATGPSSSPTGKDPSKESDTALDSALAFADPALADLGEGFIDWNELDTDFADFFNPQMVDKTVGYTPPRVSAFSEYPVIPSDQTIRMQQIASSHKPPLPMVPCWTPRSIVRRPKRESGTQRIANLILSTMKSYLVMMRRNTLPPFIHQRLMSSDEERDYVEPMSNCRSLMHVLGSEILGSRKLFWKNVRLECERFYQEVSHATAGLRGLTEC